MERSNLIELLKTFSPAEIKDFKEFLKSSYFNKRQAVANLFDVLTSYHPDYSFSRENIFAKMFPGTKYNDNTLRVLSHYLTELALKFLVFARINDDKLEYSILLQSILGERKQYKLLDKEIAKSEILLESSDFEAELYFSNKYRLENEKIYQMFASNYALYDKIVSRPAWENVSRDLDVFYMVKTMIMYLNTITYGNLYNRKVQSEKFDQVLERIEIRDYENIPVVMMYYYLIRMMKDETDESSFYKVKELLKKNKSKINKYDRTGAYVNLSSYCRMKVQKGVKRFEKESFELFKEEIGEKTYLLNDGTMSPVFFRNAVASGLQVKEFSWVQIFIRKFKSELGKRYRENYRLLCSALYEFHTGNFDAAIELNSKIVYDELYMKLNSKTLQMQLLYESGGYESLSAALESFRHFLSNNKLIPEMKKLQHSNFRKYLTQIIAVANQSNKSERELLLKNIQGESDLVSKDWLIEKLELLKG